MFRTLEQRKAPFLFAAVLCAASCAGATVSPDKGAPAYLALGDSFTIATGSRPEDAFPAVLVRLWAADGRSLALTNPAVNGYTTDDLIATELPLARTLRPSLVTVLIGANDLVRGHAEDRYREQLRKIFRGLADAGVPASAVYALPQPDWSVSPTTRAFGTPDELRARIERFNAIIKEEAERSGGTYLDIFPLMRDQARSGMLASDGLHPSREAHAQWAAALKPLLVPAALP
jgi:lysophospholipase L1-like esterase